MRTLKDKIEVDLDATAHDLEKCTREVVNKLADDLVNNLTQAAKTSMKHKEGKKKRSKPNKKWFDRNGYILRKEVKSLLNAINRQPYNRNLQARYFALRKAYNRTAKKKKEEKKRESLQTETH